MSQPFDFDVAVVGAGVAGLAAASVLEEAHLKVVILEARDRIGGRIHTVHDPRSPLPIELGAEFVHGRAPEILSLARRIPIPLVDVSWNPASNFGGVWEKNFQRDSEPVFDEVMAYRGPDLSWSDFMARSQASEDQKDSATRYIEGFEAAHPSLISVHSIQQERLASATIDDDHQFRIPGGYDQIPKFLASGLQAPIRLSTPVHNIRWAAGHVEIDGMLTARAALITLPIGVLHGQSVVFDPIPAPLKACFDIEAGQVFRAVLRFAEPIWEQNPDLIDAGFFFTDSRPFPTWWTALPIRTPLITGWAAGPRADELQGTPEQIGQRASQALSKLLKNGTPPEAVYIHDWRSDPYAQCAYSYARAGRLSARQELAAPAEKTLFFAGEAADVDGFSGTVHGAIRSGRRAAGLIRDAIG